MLIDVRARQRDHTNKNGFLVASGFGSHMFFATLLYSLSNHSLWQKAPWTLCCPVLLQIHLGGTFSLNIQRCLLNLKIKHNQSIYYCSFKSIVVRCGLEMLLFLLQYQHFRKLNFMPYEQIILYYALIFLKNYSSSGYTECLKQHQR